MIFSVCEFFDITEVLYCIKKMAEISYVLERSRSTSLHFTYHRKQKGMSDHKTIFAALPLHLAFSTPLCPELFYSTAACYPRSGESP